MKLFTITLLIIALFLAIILITGCGGYQRLLKQVPNVEFETFSYHRAGNTTSATITATGAEIQGNTLTINHLHITSDYGPFVNFDIQLKGYKREFKTEIPKVKEK